MKYSLALLLALFSLNSYAGLTKWVDAHGVVHYSDGPPPPDVKSETLVIHDTQNQAPPSQTAAESAPASAVAGPKDVFEREAERRKADKAKEEADKKAAKLEEEKKAKAVACSQAREQLNTMQNAPMVAAYDEHGERVLLDDAARQQRIQASQDAVSKYCQ